MPTANLSPVGSINTNGLRRYAQKRESCTTPAMRSGNRLSTLEAAVASCRGLDSDVLSEEDISAMHRACAQRACLQHHISVQHSSTLLSVLRARLFRTRPSNRPAVAIDPSTDIETALASAANASGLKLEDAEKLVGCGCAAAQHQCSLYQAKHANHS